MLDRVRLPYEPRVENRSRDIAHGSAAAYRHVASAPFVVPLTRNWERNRVRTQWLAHRLGIADVEPGKDIFVAGTLAARLPRLRDIQEAAKGTRQSKASYPNAQNASIPGTDFRTHWTASSARIVAGPGMWKWLQGKRALFHLTARAPYGTTNQG